MCSCSDVVISFHKARWPAGEDTLERLLKQRSTVDKNMAGLLLSSKLEIYLSPIFDFYLTQQILCIYLPLGMKLPAGETKMNVMWSLILRSLESIGRE